MSDAKDQREWKRCRRLTIGMLALPPAFLTLLMWIEDRYPGAMALDVIVAWGLVMWPGLFCLAVQPISVMDRVLIAVVYIPAAGFCLICYSFFAQCLLFGNCP